MAGATIGSGQTNRERERPPRTNGAPAEYRTLVGMVRGPLAKHKPFTRLLQTHNAERDGFLRA